MNIKVLGYKLDVKTLVIGAVLGLLICRNLACSCCNVVEGMESEASSSVADKLAEVAAEAEKKEDEEKKEDKKEKKSGMTGGDDTPGNINELMQGLNQKIEGLKKMSKEGFSNIGEKSMGDVNGSFEGIYQDKDWREGAGESHQGTQVPLPAGEMFFFAHNKFSPQCRSSYSASNGQACLSKEQIDYLNMRGGNRTLADGF